jgi:hypothetical protein
MRRGTQSIAGSVTGTAAAAKPGRRGWNIFWNILTGIALVVAGAMFLRRCGVIKF